MVLNDVDYFLIFDPNYFVNMSTKALIVTKKLQPQA